MSFFSESVEKSSILSRKKVLSSSVSLSSFTIFDPSINNNITTPNTNDENNPNAIEKFSGNTRKRDGNNNNNISETKKLKISDQVLYYHCYNSYFYQYKNYLGKRNVWCTRRGTI